MAIEIPTNLTPELVPFAWLLGTWEGTGTMWYEGQENTPFGQIINFTQDGLPYLEYRAESFLLDDNGQKLRPITIETGLADRPSPYGCRRRVRAGTQRYRPRFCRCGIG